MPSNATISIYDGEATPVERDYDPIGIDSGVAKYRDKGTETFPPGQGTATISMTENNTVRRVREQLRLNRVVTKTVEGVDFDAVADYGLAKVEFIVPVAWEQQAVDNLVTLTSNFIVASIPRGYVEEGERVW